MPNTYWRVKLGDMINDQLIDKDVAITALINWLAESEVEEFMHAQGWLDNDDDEDDS